MPYADQERNRECVRDWMRRNVARVKAAKARWRKRRRAARSVIRTVMLEKRGPCHSTATVEQDKYFRKLRRCGVPRERARLLAWGQE